MVHRHWINFRERQQLDSYQKSIKCALRPWLRFNSHLLKIFSPRAITLRHEIGLLLWLEREIARIRVNWMRIKHELILQRYRTRQLLAAMRLLVVAVQPWFSHFLLTAYRYPSARRFQWSSVTRQIFWMWLKHFFFCFVNNISTEIYARINQR